MVAAKGHSYGEWTETIAPTCTTNGEKRRDCNNCNHYETSTIGALGHNLVDVAGVAADCLNPGYTSYRDCSRCDYIEGKEVINALGHNMLTDVAVAPTCTQAGLTEGSHCSRCDYKIAQDVVVAIGHNYTSTITTKPTCTEKGVKTYTCQNDNSHKYIEEIDALGHTSGSIVVENNVAPDCVNNGSYDNVVYCTVCDAELSRETITVNALGHTEGAEATCTTAQVCTVCNTTLVAALGHTEGTTVVENNLDPDCVNNGSYDNVVYCTVCDAELSRVTVKVDALGHKDSEAVVENSTAATCGKDGSYDKVVYCKVCGEELNRTTVTVDKVPHTEQTLTAVAPTCTATGMTEGKKCTVCGSLTVEQTVVDALGHDEKSHEAKAPTCTDIGWDAYVTCSRCDYTTYNVIPATGHNYSSVVVAPTCTESGYTKYTCSVCGDTYKNNEVAALGHYMVTDEAVAPTCTEAGLTEGSHCTRCDHKVAQEVVPAKGHTAGNTVVENNVAPDCENAGSYDNVVYCTVCDAEISRTTVTVNALGHTAGAEATCTTAQVCTVCNATLVAALGHKEVIDTKVDATCTETGLTEGKHCSVCDEILVAQTVTEKLSHTLGAVVVENEVDATCTVDGSYDNVVYCTVCTVELSRETITVNALGHTAGSTVVENNVAPDCVNNGSYDNVVYCTVCDVELSRETITVNALGHTEVIDSAVNATCTETGLTEGKHCSVCNEILVAQEVVSATGHKYSETTINPTCETNGYTKHTCTCGDTYTTNEVEALGHITTTFTGKFTYRIGNQNAVALSSLFNIGKHSVTVSGTNVAGNASVTVNGASLQFNGTGLVKVTLATDRSCDECDLELTLEVVDAINATSAMDATSNNVVLLNDCGFSSLEVSGGYTLYGNGFTMTCGSDSAALDMGYTFVTLNNGTLDNVQIICPNFDYAVLYKSNMTESGNRSQTTDKTRYYNVKSGIMVSGNSQILNSRISGARAAVNVTGGNCLIDNSRIEGGAVASLLVGSANSVTLRDVTLVQKPTPSTYDSNKVLMGFSVLFICDSNGNAAPITIEGTLVQDAWVNESYKQYVPSAGQSIINTVLGKTEYLHDIDNDGTKESVNLGFAFMPESEGSSVKSTNITDNRSNKDQIPYQSTDISLLGIFTTKVYSYLNSKGTVDSFKNADEYKPNKYGDIITVNYSDNKDGLESGKSFETSGWVYELNVDLDKASGYKLDFSKLTMVINGVSVTDYKVNGGNKPSTVSVTAGGVTYTLTATINGKEYTATFKVTGTETSKESPSKISGPTTAGFGVAGSYGGDWTGGADVLTGVKIKYWSVAENKYVEFDFSNFTVPGSAGKLNGTNSYWEYTHTNNDFTLKVTNTVAIHSGKSVYGMPIRGTDGKLYFTISSTNGYVGSGTTSRAITMQYEFTDNNGGEKLVFTHTFNISYNKDNQYSYSDLSGSGKLTKLEDSSCFVEGTLITMADGTQKPVEDLVVGDMIMIFNHVTGKYEDMPLIFNTHADEVEYKNYDVLYLQFADGRELKIVQSHGLFDTTLMQYVYINYDNYQDYIGHKFYSMSEDGIGERVELLDAFIQNECVRIYCPVTYFHMNSFANGFLNTPNIPGDITGLVNYFEYDDNLKYNEEKMQADIEKYGLYTYDDFSEYISEDAYLSSPSVYLKVAVGKGMITYEQIIDVIEYLLAGSLIDS